ncbi:MAG: PilZ domain-containing protein [Pyrinomonadaceae bacterium]
MIEQQNPASSNLQRPRSPRVPASFEVQIEGHGADGEPFNVRARTVKVSHRGATIVTDAKLQPGMMMLVTPSFWKALEAEVTGVWVNEADGRQHVGLKLIHPSGWFART